MKKQYITKSDITSHMRCPLKAWLENNSNKMVVDDCMQPMAINGMLAGEKAREMFEGGVLVDTGDMLFAVNKTTKLMADKDVHTIYEATFLADGVLVKADIMVRTDNGWNLIEVKSATKLDKKYHEDITIQKIIIEKAGIEIATTMLMYVNKEFRFTSADNYADLFLFEDTKESCEDLKLTIELAIESAKRNIAIKTEPKAEMAGMCKHDGGCGAKKYCESLAPDDHISFLPRGGTVQKKIWKKDQSTRISEIPAGLLTSDTHIKVRDITMNGEEHYEPGALAAIEALPFPHHYLDFESIQFAVPRWEGVKPWRQVAFQYSDHVHNEDGTKSYGKFLDVSGNDPRRAFADALVEQCGHDEGAVLVYNKSFEQMIMRDLATDFPDLADELKSIQERCFDLLPIMRNHYYSPDMKGSWSIKKVLNCFVPELSYGDLDEVSNGLEAQVAYLNLVDPTWTGDKVKLKENALAYCKFDTYSMVKLVEGIKLREK